MSGDAVNPDEPDDLMAALTLAVLMFFAFAAGATTAALIALTDLGAMDPTVTGSV